VRVLLATNNAGKLREAREILPEVEWLSLADLPPLPAAIEDGTSFEENARKKALHYGPLVGLPTVGEDSGLCVDALGGRPGVLSARYGGDVLDGERCRLLLAELEGVPEEQRAASFRCCAALVVAGEVRAISHGEVRGRILLEPAGSHGFGYDPVFLYPPLGRSFAALTLAEKNAVSHRRRALQGLLPHLRKP